MRENRPYGLEGGESGSTGLPYPYRATMAMAMATNVGYVIISCRYRRGGTRRIRGRRV
jgi:hypothetical protein